MSPNDAVPSPTARYEILEEIARGGMGVVFRVRDLDLDRVLALKRLANTKKVRSSEARQDFFARFLEEVQVTAQLDHPAIVPVHELGFDDDGTPFYTMRLVKGHELGEIIRLSKASEDDWNLTRLIEVMVKVCQAVAYAHGKGVIHRDLKPANIMVGDLGEVYVMDWGLARMLVREDMRDLRIQLEENHDGLETVTAARAADPDVSLDRALMTMDGGVIGTPAYMAPEQADGRIEQVDHLSDVYALGAILYQTLAGHPPYMPQGSTVTAREVLTELRERPPQRVLRKETRFPPELVAICEKAMSRERRARYTSAHSLAEDLQNYIDGRVVQAHETGPVVELKKWFGRNRAVAMLGATAVLIAIIGLATMLVLEHQARERVMAANESTVDALAQMYTATGLRADERGETEKAALWFAEAASLSQDHTERKSQLMRCRAWLQETTSMVRVLPVLDAGRVARMRFHPRLPYLLVTAAENEVWDIVEERALEVGGRPLGWSHSGDLLFVSEFDSNTVWVKSFPEGEIATELRVDGATNIFPFATTRDDRLLATGDGTEGLEVWDLTTRQRLGRDPFVGLRDLAFAPNGERLLARDFRQQLHVFALKGVSDEAAMVRLWGPDSQALKADWNFQPMFVNEGRELLVASEGMLHWIDVETGRSARELAGVQVSGTVTKDGRYLAYGGDGESGLVDLKSGERFVTVRHDGGTPRFVRVGSDSSVLFLGIGSRVERFQVEDGRRLQPLLPSHQDDLTAAAVSSDGRWVATAGLDQFIRIHRAEPERSFCRMLGPFPKAPLRGVFHPNGEYVAVSGTAYCDATPMPAAQVYWSENGEPAGPVFSLDGHLTAVSFVNGQPDQLATASLLGDSKPPKSHAASAVVPGQVELWNWRTGERLAGPIPLPSDPRDMAAHPSEHWFGVMCGAHLVKVDFARDEMKILVTSKPTAAVFSHHNGQVAFSEEGRWLMGWSAVDQFYCWDTQKGALAFEPQSNEGRCYYGVATHPDGVAVSVELFASHLDNGRFARFWDLETGEAFPLTLPHSNQMFAAEFSEDGQTLLTTSQGRGKLWDWRTGNPVAPDLEFPDRTAPLRSAAFVPGHPWIVAGNERGQLGLWDRRSGNRMSPIYQGSPPVSLDFLLVSPKGDRALASGIGVEGLNVYHLDQFQRRVALPLEAWRTLAEVSAGARLEDSRLRTLSRSEWLARWRAFRRQYPDYHSL